LQTHNDSSGNLLTSSVGVTGGAREIPEICASRPRIDGADLGDVAVEHVEVVELAGGDCDPGLHPRPGGGAPNRGRRRQHSECSECIRVAHGAPAHRHVESLGRHAAEVFEVVGTVLYGLGT